MARTNDEWLAALRADPPEDDAIEELLRFLRRGLTSGLRDKGIDRADAEDFAQLAAVRILSRLDSFRGDSKFTTWALSIAVRVAFSELRRKRWGDVSLDAYENPPEPATPPRAHQQLEREHLHATLHHAIHHALTERQRTLILAELDGVPGVVLAERLGVKAGALYKMYHDARKKLRHALTEQGIDPTQVRNVTDSASDR